VEKNHHHKTSNHQQQNHHHPFKEVESQDHIKQLKPKLRYKAGMIIMFIKSYEVKPEYIFLSGRIVVLCLLIDFLANL